LVHAGKAKEVHAPQLRISNYCIPPSSCRSVELWEKSEDF